MRKGRKYLKRFAASVCMAANAFQAAAQPCPVAAWTHRSPPMNPEGRCQAGMVFDQQRGKHVLLGGMYSQFFNVWEWDVSEGQWSVRSAGEPEPFLRHGHGLVYDTRRNTVLLFGGTANEFNDHFGDTWEWNGSAGVWQQRSPLVSPMPREAMSMAYDSDRGVAVLFGGWHEGQILSDIWEWDGESGTWTQRQAGAGPSPRFGAAVTYDKGRQRVVLFGGAREFDRYDDVWEWDGVAGTWAQVQVQSVDGPLARYGAMLTYDTLGHRAVMFGGTAGYAGYDAFNDTWSWDGSTRHWLRIPTEVAPPARSWQAMTYDDTHHCIVLFGGLAVYPDMYGDTWQWSATVGWEQRATQDAPPARWGHAMAYDTPHSCGVLFGGTAWSSSGGAGPSDETWVWRGSEGNQGLWTQKTPTVSPTKRTYPAMAFDELNGNVVLFGGELGSGSYYNDFWKWDIATSQWTEIQSSTRPSVRSRHALAYDRSRNTLVLFGGGIWGQTFGDTWEWNATTGVWTDRSVANSPSPRERHAMAYDAQRGTVLLFGGQGYGAQFFGDTWEWNGTTGLWSYRSSALGPSTRAGHSMAYDPARGRVVLFGGHDQFNFDSRLWEWDGQAGEWMELTPTPRPEPLRDSSLIYDSTRQRCMTFGGAGSGSGAYRVRRDTWEWSGMEGPTFNRQPSDLQVRVGQRAVLEVELGGVQPFSYEWTRGYSYIWDDGRVQGTATPTLTIDPVIAADAMFYHVYVTDACGRRVSRRATLSVIGACAADIDLDGAARPADVATFVSRWYRSVQIGNTDADFDGSGTVTPADIAAFLAAWMDAVTGTCG